MGRSQGHDCAHKEWRRVKHFQLHGAAGEQVAVPVPLIAANVPTKPSCGALCT